MVCTWLHFFAPARLTRCPSYQIAALSILHENEIVHRDIKPDNFLVDPAGGAILVDFGLSLEIDLYGVINGVCGTVDYLAPEQWRGSSYDSQVDVWQLGCTFIELFARLRGTWIGTFGKGNNPLARVDLSLEELQAVLDYSVQDLLPEGHPAKDLVLVVSSSLLFFLALTLNFELQMIKLHPGDRATVEELKAFPWFHGIDWDAVAYGPTVERKCITPTRHILSMLIRVHRQLQTAQCTDQHAHFAGLRYVLRSSFEAEDGPRRRRGHPNADGDVRGRAVCIRPSASRTRRFCLKYMVQPNDLAPHHLVAPRVAHDNAARK